MSFPSRNARQRGFYQGAVESDPDDPQDGVMWYNTTDDELRVQKDGSPHDVDTTEVT